MYEIEIYLTGIYEENKMHFVGLIKAPKQQSVVRRLISGTEIECRINATGIMLNLVSNTDLPIVVYTNFEDIVLWGNGMKKVVSQRARDFFNYLKRRRKKQRVAFQNKLSSDMLKELIRLLQGQAEEQTATVNPFKAKNRDAVTSLIQKMPMTFRVTVTDKDGKILADYNQEDFGGVLKDAVFFADWYETESKNEDSIFYKCVVKRTGVLETANAQLKGSM